MIFNLLSSDNEIIASATTFLDALRKITSETITIAKFNNGKFAGEVWSR